MKDSLGMEMQKVLAQDLEEIKTWLNEKGYKEVGVYSNLNMFLNGGLNTLDKKIPRWISEYYYRCEYPDEYIGWQYTNSYKIPGINQLVDMNIFY